VLCPEAVYDMPTDPMQGYGPDIVQGVDTERNKLRPKTGQWLSSYLQRMVSFLHLARIDSGAWS